MKAIRLYGKGEIRLEEVAIPTISEDEVLIKVKSAAVCGTDLRMIQHGADGIDQDHPRIIGHEVSGVIEAVGKHITHYRKGMRVAAAPNLGCGICDSCVAGNTHLCTDYQALGINIDGGFAEYMKIPQAAVWQGNLSVLDEQLSFAEAAVVEPLSCVYNGQQQVGIRPGDQVLIIGAGPIGIMHGIMAKFHGAAVVMMNDISAQRLDYSKKVEPSFQIMTQTNLAEQIMQATNHRGVDVCIVACPSPEAQAMAVTLTGLFGRVLFFGGLPKDRELVPINTNRIHYQQISLHGSTRASLSQYRKVLKFATSGVIDLTRLMTNTYQIDQYQDAFSAASRAEGLKHIFMF